MARLTRTLITGGEVVTPTGMRRLDVMIEGERFTELLTPDTGAVGSVDEEIDAGGMVVLPGLIDAHTHFIQNDEDAVTPDPDAVEYEGFLAGGRAAAAGGVTTVIEMPQSYPPARDGTTFDRKRKLAEVDAVVDFALWGGLLPDQNTGDLEDQIALGAAGLKAFMCDSDPMYRGIDDGRLLEAMQIVSGYPLMIGLHAESQDLLAYFDRLTRGQGRVDPLAHALARPPIVEWEAVSRAIVLAEYAGAWVHFVHLSTPQAAALVRTARQRGVQVTAETCPQYLALDHADLERLAGFARCAPAIRAREDVEALWLAVRGGAIDCVTSDHCGFTVESKELGRENIFDAPNGLSGIQTLGPVTWSEARARGLSWEQIADLLSAAPARLWGLAPSKGAIQVGADADLVIIDPEREWTVAAADLLHTHRWTPFEGRRLTGVVVRTILRGRTVHAEGTSIAADLRPGSGRFVRAWEGAVDSPAGNLAPSA